MVNDFEPVQRPGDPRSQIRRYFSLWMKRSVRRQSNLPQLYIYTPYQGPLAFRGHLSSRMLLVLPLCLRFRTGHSGRVARPPWCRTTNLDQGSRHECHLVVQPPTGPHGPPTHTSCLLDPTTPDTRVPRVRGPTRSQVPTVEGETTGELATSGGETQRGRGV